MPSKPRFNLPGVPQHVIQRGNDHEPCFYSEKDYQQYLKDLKQSASKYHCRIHAYVLMTNHVQLLVTPMKENGVSLMMNALGQCYAKYCNRADTGVGGPGGSYKSSLIDSDIYLLACMCYIELKPVRAKLVTYPGEYRWSSYRRNALVGDDKVISSHPIYLTLGETDDERRFVYRELFQRHLENDVIHQIRDALNREQVLGRSSFKDRIEEITNWQARLSRLSKNRIEEVLAEYYIFG